MPGVNGLMCQINTGSNNTFRSMWIKQGEHSLYAQSKHTLKKNRVRVFFHGSWLSPARRQSWGFCEKIWLRLDKLITWLRFGKGHLGRRNQWWLSVGDCRRTHCVKVRHFSKPPTSSPKDLAAVFRYATSSLSLWEYSHYLHSHENVMKM